MSARFCVDALAVGMAEIAVRALSGSTVCSARMAIVAVVIDERAPGCSDGTAIGRVLDLLLLGGRLGCVGVQIFANFGGPAHEVAPEHRDPVDRMESAVDHASAECGAASRPAAAAPTATPCLQTTAVRCWLLDTGLL